MEQWRDRGGSLEQQMEAARMERLKKQRKQFGQQCRELQALELRAKKLIAQLVKAIGRHPAAEDDPAVADAVNAIEEALKQFDNSERVC